MTIPDNFYTGIPGAELLKVGFPDDFPKLDDWVECRHADYWKKCVSVYPGFKYKINPERLKPKAPRVGALAIPDRTPGFRILYETKATELTDQVRRRLSEDAGVDIEELVSRLVMGTLTAKDVERIVREEIAAASVEVKE